MVGVARQVDRQRGESPGAAEHLRTVGPDADDRIVHRADDRPIVRQQHVGDRARAARWASSVAIAIGSSERLPLVQTIGRPTAAISRWCSGV